MCRSKKAEDRKKKKRASDGSKLHLASISPLVQSYLTWTTIAGATELN